MAGLGLRQAPRERDRESRSTSEARVCAARNFALTNDQEGDDRLIRELTEATYDGVVIGGYINGQDPEVPPTEQTTQWFNRILNIIHTHAPATTIILTRNPPDALPAIERVLGNAPGSFSTSMTEVP